MKLALILWNIIPGGKRVRPCGQFRIVRYPAEFLLIGEYLLPQRVPTRIKPVLVLICPLLEDVVRAMRGARSLVDKDRPVRCQSVDLLHPRHGFTSHVFGKVIAFFAMRRINPVRVFNNRRLPL